MKKHFNLLGATLLLPSLLLANTENTHSLAVSILKSENQSVSQIVEKKITGVVYDEAGLPVIGANILEKGTTNGTITDMDGNFTLTVSDNATLLVSYIG